MFEFAIPRRVPTPRAHTLLLESIRDFSEETEFMLSRDLCRAVLQEAAAKGAMLDTADWSISPLNVAIQRDAPVWMAALADAGVDVAGHWCPPWGSMLFEALRTQKYRVALLLLEQGSDALCRHDGGKAALHFAVAFDPEATPGSKTRERQLAVVRALIDRGVDVRAENKMRQLAIYSARDPIILRALLDAGSPIESGRGSQRWSPLQPLVDEHRAGNDRLEAIATLLDAGANLDLGCRAGRQDRTLAVAMLEVPALEGMVRATLARRAAQEAIGGCTPGLIAG